MKKAEKKLPVYPIHCGIVKSDFCGKKTLQEKSQKHFRKFARALNKENGRTVEDDIVSIKFSGEIFDDNQMTLSTELVHRVSNVHPFVQRFS